MIDFLSIAGGVALILFGIRFLRKGLDRLFGPTLGRWMQRLARNRFLAFLAGLFVSSLTPSSTTISVLTVETVQQGHLSPRQMLAVALGANIGLTLTAILISFQIDSYALILVLMGVVLFQLTRGPRSRGVGQIVLSLGLIFLAVYLIRQNVAHTLAGMGQDSDVIKLIAIAENHPVWLAMMGAALTIALQSSTATMGLIIGVTSGGVNSLSMAFPIVMGANIGLALTTLMVGWRQTDSRRMSLSNFLLKSTVAVAMLATAPFWVQWISNLPGSPTSHIAITHTGYNILVAMVGLPLIGPVSRIAEALVPAPARANEQKFGPKYIQFPPVDSPALALGQSRREIVRVSEIVREMFDDLWRALKGNDEEQARAIAQRDDQVDLLDAQIKRFLTRLGAQNNGIANSQEQIDQLSYLTELETIGDIIDKNLSELVVKKIKLRVDFSPEGWRELDDFYRKVAENLLIADTAFTTRDPLLAHQILRHKEQLSILERQLRDQHFARLNAHQPLTYETTAIHLDLLTHLKRINSCVSHVGYAILQSDQPSKNGDGREAGE